MRGYLLYIANIFRSLGSEEGPSEVWKVVLELKGITNEIFLQ